MRDTNGAWKTVMTTGFPVGRPQTVLVDLAGKWLGPSREVRIVTNMRIYWDEARAGRAAPGPAPQPRTFAATRMDLRERGFSAAVSPDAREPFSFDYQRAALDPHVERRVFTRRGEWVGEITPAFHLEFQPDSSCRSAAS